MFGRAMKTDTQNFYQLLNSAMAGENIAYNETNVSTATGRSFNFTSVLRNIAGSSGLAELRVFDKENGIYLARTYRVLGNTAIEGLDHLVYQVQEVADIGAPERRGQDFLLLENPWQDPSLQGEHKDAKIISFNQSS
jgi:hypothetical protein